MTWHGASTRATRNASVGIRDRAKSRVHRSREWNDMMAGAAEDTVRRRQGWPRPHLTQQPDRGWDDVLPDGRTSDTKWSEYETASLICDPESSSRADIYILVVGDDPDDLLIVGWATKEELKQPGNMRLLSDAKDRTPCWCLSQSQLHSIEEL